MKQLEFRQRHCAACDPQQRYLHGTASLKQVVNGLSCFRARRRTVCVRAEADYGEQHPVLTAPLRDAHRTLR